MEVSKALEYYGSKHYSAVVRWSSRGFLLMAAHTKLMDEGSDVIQLIYGCHYPPHRTAGLGGEGGGL